MSPKVTPIPTEVPRDGRVRFRFTLCQVEYEGTNPADLVPQVMAALEPYGQKLAAFIVKLNDPGTP